MKVFITGASSGLGAALAKEYGKSGSTLGLIARRTNLLNQLASQLPCETVVYPLDVSNTSALQNAAENFIARYGVPDIVIANAGVSVGTLSEMQDDISVLQKLLSVNVVAMSATFQPFIAAMRSRRRGALVGIASIAGFRGIPGAGAYSASKAAAISYLESLRVEVHGSGVDVITVCPGYIATPMTAVNPYAMPFIISAEEAGRRIANAVQQRKKFYVLPWQMAFVSRIFRLLPNWLYDRLLSRAPHKPRGLSI